MKAHLMMLAALGLSTLVGCGGTFYDAHVGQGGVLNETRSESGLLSMKTVSTDHRQQYPDCLAKLGEMPRGEEVALCVRQVKGDDERRTWVLDLQSGRWIYHTLPPNAYAGYYGNPYRPY